MKKRIFYSSIVILAAVFSFNSCIENTVSTIPDYPVNLRLDLTATYSTFYNSIGQQIYTKSNQIYYNDNAFPLKETERTGFGGILIYTNYERKYCAVDMACPYEAKRDVCVEIDGLEAVCPECGSKFDIYNSEYAPPSKGPVTQALKKYKTQLSSNGILLIYR